MLSFLLDGVLGQIFIIFLTGIAVAYAYLKYIFNYWENKGIPAISNDLPFGYMNKIVSLKKSFAEVYQDIYNKSSEEKFVGVYSFFTPQLLVNDLDLIKDILVKDFNKFVDRGTYVNEKVDPLTGNLFFLEGQPWRNLRAKLSPTFTSGKMKTMFSTIKDTAIELQKYGIKLISNDDTVDVKDMTARYGLEVITNVALGIEGNNFKNDNTDMRKIVHSFIAPSSIQMIRITACLLCKSLANLFQIRFTPKEVENYFFNIIKQNIEYRQKNNIKRNDFMQILMELKDDSDDNNKNVKSQKDNSLTLSLSEIVAQSFVFTIAGFETTSVTLGFCLYELALNPHVQDRLIEELDAAGMDVQYDVLQNLPYLDMVVNETLRKHPPVPVLQRESVDDYVLPGGKILSKGTLIVISVIGLHRDPKYFPNPDEFDPERFSKENVKNILPYTYLPFGEGPRVCIGNRFAKMQVKLAIAALLSHFRVEKSDKTPVPFVFEKKTFTYNSEGGMWLRLKERKSKD